MRIVSLLPSATEIVALLGLEDQLVGVSHECDFPNAVSKLPHVTRSTIPPGLPSEKIDQLVTDHLQTEKALYHLNMELLQQLQPDLIVTQALCDVCAVSAEEVDAAVCSLPGNPQVVNLEPMSLQEVFDTIEQVGMTTGREARARVALDNLQGRVDFIREKSAMISRADKPGVGFLEWINPLFNAGHWTPEIIEYAGGINSFGSKNMPSRRLMPEELVRANPEVLIVAQCGFEEERCRQDIPALCSLPGFDKLACSRTGELYYTDGNAYFSRPGPRLVESLELLAHCLHPQLFSLPSGLAGFIKFSASLDGESNG